MQQLQGWEKELWEEQVSASAASATAFAEKSLLQAGEPREGLAAREVVLMT
jgi:hypothetical protein